MKKSALNTYAVVFAGDYDDVVITKAKTTEEAFEFVCADSFERSPEEMLEVCNVEVHKIADTFAVHLKPKIQTKQYYTVQVK